MLLLPFMLSLSPVWTYLIHALLIRVLKNKPIQLTVLFSILIGNISIVIMCIVHILKVQVSNTEDIILIFYTLIVYNALSYLYFHIFNMSETARRIHILVDLKKFGTLKKEDLFSRYSPRHIVDTRLKRLLSLKQLKVEDNNYKINSHFLLMAARMYIIWVRLLGFNK